jgi:hypothetical protein
MDHLKDYQKLTSSKEFQDWKKNNSETYLSHFYCQLDSSFKQKSPWEIGFYNKKHDKITIFIIDETVTLKPEEEVFKKEGTVEKLDLEKVKIDSQNVLEIFQKTKQELYSPEVLLNGFLILQNFQDKTLWNISFATKSLSILNVKINAASKKVVSHQLINFIEKKTS